MQAPSPKPVPGLLAPLARRPRAFFSLFPWRKTLKHDIEQRTNGVFIFTTRSFLFSVPLPVFRSTPSASTPLFSRTRVYLRPVPSLLPPRSLHPPSLGPRAETAKCDLANAAPAQKNPRCRVLLQTGCPALRGSAVGCYVSLLWECVGHGPSCSLGLALTPRRLLALLARSAKEHFDVSFVTKVFRGVRFGYQTWPSSRASAVCGAICTWFARRDFE
jgi:hypothetical protein